MNKKASIVCIEGIEGTGKTTVWKELENSLKNDKYKFISSKYTKIQELFSETDPLPDEELLLQTEVAYLVLEAITTHEIVSRLKYLKENHAKTRRKKKKNNDVIIMERGWLSTRLYGSLRSEHHGKILNPDIWKFQHKTLDQWCRIYGGDISQELLTIYFEIDPNVALKRIQNSDRPEHTKNIEWLKHSQKLYETALEDWHWRGQVVRINTNDKSIDDIYKECLTLINNHCR